MQEKWLDNAAIGASGLCLIHCLILPVAVLVLPFLAAALGNLEWFHAAIFGFCSANQPLCVVWRITYPRSAQTAGLWGDRLSFFVFRDLD